MNDSEPITGGIREIAQRALQLVIDKHGEEAALLLFRHAYRFLITRMENGAPRFDAPGLSFEDAEEQVYPLIGRFVRSSPKGETSGLTWLIKVTDSHLVDTHRRRRAKKRGGDLQISSLHDDEGGVRPEAEAAKPLWPSEHRAVNLGLDDCMERATDELEGDHPTYARVLRLIRQGLDGDELVAHYADDPEHITDKERNNFKSRKSTALKKAREYFEPCKELNDD